MHKVLNSSADSWLQIYKFQTKEVLMIEAFADSANGVRGTYGSSLLDVWCIKQRTENARLEVE